MENEPMYDTIFKLTKKRLNDYLFSKSNHNVVWGDEELIFSNGLCADIEALVHQKIEEAEKKLIEEIESLLSIEQDEIGFIEISNHVQSMWWQQLKKSRGIV
jgi:hypothetical protein